MDFRQAANEYRSLLLDDVLPWWLRHAMDREHGGLFSCIGDDGAIQSRDKYIWSQVRALWTFAAAHRRIKTDPEFAAVADQLFEFTSAHGRNNHGDWVFRVSEDGTQVLDGPDSIQTDAFAICAMVEYALASGRREPMDIAQQTYRRSLAKLSRPGSYLTRPYPIPAGARPSA